MKNTIEFTRIDNDTNGNPRYVCHFLNLLKEGESGYNTAITRAHKIGGRKYHTKKYGGGIVFQSYNIHATEKTILELMGETITKSVPKTQNLRGFKVTFTPASNTKPNRVKIHDMRHNKTILVSYVAETPDNDTDLAKYTLSNLGIPVIAQVWDEKDKYTILLSDNFTTQIK